MKRYLWLLALPYVVNVSTNYHMMSELKGNPDHEDTTKEIYFNGKPFWDDMHIICSVPDETNCDWMDDIAAALNEAHERRYKTPPGLVRNKDGDLVPSNLNKKEADLYWKDSKKAEWENGTVITTDPPTYEPAKKITNKEACGQNDCGADPK